MQEDFLHYIWKFRKYAFAKALTTQGDAIEVVKVGVHNKLAGPDFFDARVRIAGTLWVGNVEVHIKSSDWYVHGHEQDAAYENVILHVVWEDDVAVFNKSNIAVPTLQLKDYISQDLLKRYLELFTHKKTTLNCAHALAHIPDSTFELWVERVYFERLERKVKEIYNLLEFSKNDWEAVLFKMLAKNFGTKVNAEVFAQMASVIPFTTVRKLANKTSLLEALFMGYCNMIPSEVTSLYEVQLQNDYKFIQAKFRLPEKTFGNLQYFKLRPPNFPTIRLSQLANLYASNTALFSSIKTSKSVQDYYTLLRVGVSSFWETHYTFKKAHKSKTKFLTKNFIDLVIVNTIIPIQFAYAKQQGRSIDEELVTTMLSLKAENNSIVKKFTNLREIQNTALHSQALLQLYQSYCSQNRCLHCEIGSFIISSP